MEISDIRLKKDIIEKFESGFDIKYIIPLAVDEKTGKIKAKKDCL